MTNQYAQTKESPNGEIGAGQSKSECQHFTLFGIIRQAFRPTLENLFQWAVCFGIASLIWGAL